MLGCDSPGLSVMPKQGARDLRDCLIGFAGLDPEQAGSGWGRSKALLKGSETRARLG